MDNLFAKTVTTQNLASEIAGIDILNVRSVYANAISSKGGIEAAAASFGNVSCAPKTLSIGGRTCTFFAPADATFELSDMPGYADALDAAKKKVSISRIWVTSPSVESIDNVWYFTAALHAETSEGKTGADDLQINVDSFASGRYNAGRESVTIPSNNITCTNTGPNTFYVTVKASNGASRSKTFTINVGQK